MSRDITEVPPAGIEPATGLGNRCARRRRSEIGEIRSETPRVTRFTRSNGVFCRPLRGHEGRGYEGEGPRARGARARGRGLARMWARTSFPARQPHRVYLAWGSERVLAAIRVKIGAGSTFAAFRLKLRYVVRWRGRAKVLGAIEPATRILLIAMEARAKRNQTFETTQGGAGLAYVAPLGNVFVVQDYAKLLRASRGDGELRPEATFGTSDGVKLGVWSERPFLITSKTHERLGKSVDYIRS